MLLKIIVITVIGGLVTMWMLSDLEPVYVENKIVNRATQNLSIVGCYDSHLTVSVKHWVYGILVTLYRQDKNLKGIDVVQSWYQTSVNEEGDVIQSGIQEAYSQFLAEVNKAQEEEKEPVFKLSGDWDICELPKTIRYNDRIDADSMIHIVQTIKEGKKK